jgi:hypothetical protein
VSRHCSSWEQKIINPNFFKKKNGCSYVKHDVNIVAHTLAKQATCQIIDMTWREETQFVSVYKNLTVWFNNDMVLFVKKKKKN